MSVDFKSNDILLPLRFKRFPLTQKELFSVICENDQKFNLPKLEVIQGISSFLINKKILTTESASLSLREILLFLEKLNIVTNGINFYKSNAFKYIYEGENLNELLEQILNNAEFWIKKFGIDFFSRFSAYSKERKTLIQANIDDDFFLSCKGGSGVGTFSIDFAIGIRGTRTFAKNIPSGELWRTGIDTQKSENQTAMRIIRTGGTIKKTKENYEKKREMYTKFRKKYGVSPPRALAFLCMYVGKDLDVNEIKAISLVGAKQKKLSLIKSSYITYDYTKLFESVGFKKSDNPNWLTIGDPQENFYKAIQTSRKNNNGLRAYETFGLDKVLGTFRKLKDVLSSQIKNPLTVCSDETKEEILKAIKCFRIIHNKHFK